MNAADSACYVAKKQGDSHVHVYSSHDEAVARSRGEIHWLQRLQAALRDGFFELYVQPIEPTRPGSTSGPAMEVFVRLHDEGQAVAPAEFFPAAERYRLMSHDRPLGARLGARGARGRRDPPAAGPQPVDQHLGPDARRSDVPRVRRGRARPHRRAAGADLLRGRRDRR